MVEHEESGVFTLIMHPQVMGHSHRIALLERVVRHILSKDSRALSEWVTWQMGLREQTR
jgi:hypothetical protein